MLPDPVTCGTSLVWPGPPTAGTPGPCPAGCVTAPVEVVAVGTTGAPAVVGAPAGGCGGCPGVVPGSAEGCPDRIRSSSCWFSWEAVGCGAAVGAAGGGVGLGCGIGGAGAVGGAPGAPGAPGAAGGCELPSCSTLTPPGNAVVSAAPVVGSTPGGDAGWGVG
jgi:hypothetical protein